MQGISMVPWLTDSGKAEEPRTLYWQHEVNAAVREGNWKLIWNRTDDHQALYDMRIPGEQQPMQQDAAARTAALMQILEKHLHDVTRERLALLGRATRDGVAIEDLPENERRLLIELGYFEREARINPEPSH